MFKMIRTITIAAMIIALYASTVSCLSHAIEVSLFPPDKSLRCRDTIHLQPDEIEDRQVRFLINKALTVESVSAGVAVEHWYTEEDVDPAAFKAEPDSADVELINRAKGVFITFEGPLPLHEPISVQIEYAGVIYDSLEAPARTYAKGFATTTGLIEERGVYLSNESLWYPFQYGKMLTFVLKVDVPFDWMTVSQGDLTDEWGAAVDDEDRVFAIWTEPNPAPEIYLVAGKYYRHEEYHNGIWVRTYTYEQSDSLSQVYMDATKHYLTMYEGMIGQYPYGKFALVENFWQTGYGMPSFTLLGSRVIRLPFIVRTSYGHEILHNWWGNSVYVDYATGNWCEGLTTYGADYLYKEQMSEAEARDYRHHTLIAFTNYVAEAKDFPLSEFHERHDAASQSVGYGKSLMVYHMLRKSLGDSLFWKGLREFYARSKFTTASWHDLKVAFSDVSGRDLTWFFDQWTTRTGTPSIGLMDADYSGNDGTYIVKFTLKQDQPAFVIDLPVVIETTHGAESVTVRLHGTDSTYATHTRACPVGIAIDPDYDTFRKLYIEEIPVTLGALFGQDSVAVVIGSDEGDTARAGYRKVAAAWGLAEHTVDEAEFDEIRISNEHIWLLGRGKMLRDVLGLRQDHIEISDRTATVSGSEFPLADNTLVSAFRNPHDENLTVAVVLSEDMESLLSLAARIPHYSSYSYLGFAGGRPVLKGVWGERRSPLRIDFKAR